MPRNYCGREFGSSKYTFISYGTNRDVTQTPNKRNLRKVYQIKRCVVARNNCLDGTSQQTVPRNKPLIDSSSSNTGSSQRLNISKPIVKKNMEKCEKEHSKRKLLHMSSGYLSENITVIEEGGTSSSEDVSPNEGGTSSSEDVSQNEVGTSSSEDVSPNEVAECSSCSVQVDLSLDKSGTPLTEVLCKNCTFALDNRKSKNKKQGLLKRSLVNKQHNTVDIGTSPIVVYEATIDHTKATTKRSDKEVNFTKRTRSGRKRGVERNTVTVQTSTTVAAEQIGVQESKTIVPATENSSEPITATPRETKRTIVTANINDGRVDVKNNNEEGVAIRRTRSTRMRGINTQVDADAIKSSAETIKKTRSKNKRQIASGVISSAKPSLKEIRASEIIAESTVKIIPKQLSVLVETDENKTVDFREQVSNKILIESVQVITDKDIASSPMTSCVTRRRYNTRLRKRKSMDTNAGIYSKHRRGSISNKTAAKNVNRAGHQNKKKKLDKKQNENNTVNLNSVNVTFVDEEDVNLSVTVPAKKAEKVKSNRGRNTKHIRESICYKTAKNFNRAGYQNKKKTQDKKQNENNTVNLNSTNVTFVDEEDVNLSVTVPAKKAEKVKSNKGRNTKRRRESICSKTAKNVNRAGHQNKKKNLDKKQNENNTVKFSSTNVVFIDEKDVNLSATEAKPPEKVQSTMGRYKKRRKSICYKTAAKNVSRAGYQNKKKKLDKKQNENNVVKPNSTNAIFVDDKSVSLSVILTAKKAEKVVSVACQIKKEKNGEKGTRNNKVKFNSTNVTSATTTTNPSDKKPTNTGRGRRKRSNKCATETASTSDNVTGNCEVDFKVSRSSKVEQSKSITKRGRKAKNTTKKPAVHVISDAQDTEIATDVVKITDEKTTTGRCRKRRVNMSSTNEKESERTDTSDNVTGK